MKTRNPRQTELDAYASRRFWNRGPYRSWSKGAWTIAVNGDRYVVVERKTLKRSEVGTLDELDRMVGDRSRVG